LEASHAIIELLLSLNKGKPADVMGSIQDTFRTVRLEGSVTANLTNGLASKAMRCERQANLLNRVLGERADVNDDQFPRTPTKDDIESLWQGLQKYI